MVFHKRRHRIAFGRLPNEIRHVDGEEIGATKILVDCIHVNVVGIHVPALIPAKGRNCPLGSVVNTLRLRTDEVVLAVGFVPNRNHLDPLLSQFHTRLQLRCSLMCKPVAHAYGVFL